MVLGTAAQRCTAEQHVRALHPTPPAQLLHALFSAAAHHVAAQFVDGLPRIGGRVRVEAALGAALHQLEAAGCGEAEDAHALGGVLGGHHNGHSLVQHGLEAAVGVDVHGGEEAGLGGVRVDPA